jgi:serine protease inhibitor
MSATRTTEREVTKAEEAFALELTRLELAGSSGGNVLLSPMSADLALAMVELGSAGATQRQIATTLQSTGLSATIQAAAIHELVDQFTSGGSAGELKVANSLGTTRTSCRGAVPTPGGRGVR